MTEAGRGQETVRLPPSRRPAEGTASPRNREQVKPGLVPPYDRPLPGGYWESLKPRKAPRSKPRRPLTLPDWRWIPTLGALALGGLFVWWLFSLPNALIDKNSVHTDAEVAQSAAAESAAAAHVPKAIGRYWVDMPDGRRILVNFKGTIQSFGQLPVQPSGGANNAAYSVAADGNTWIWTVPAGASNIPRWIDP